MPIALIIHGGAWAIPDSQVEANLVGCKRALEAGWSLLRSGASALDACEAAVRTMEDDPTFNAGIGSVLNVDGEVELDAAVMDGRTLAYGAVSTIRHIRNPVTLARHVLAGPATLLAGAGAERFAIDQGMSLCPNQELIVEQSRSVWQRACAKRERHLEAGADSVQHLASPGSESYIGHDTVGAIALDHQGGLIAASSTGGILLKLPGRVGDTPLVGSGLYADATIGACVATGWGEAITRMALARRAVDLLERGISTHVAAQHVITLLARRVPGGNGGCILLNAQGQIGLAWNTPRMAYAYRSEGSEMMYGI